MTNSNIKCPRDDCMFLQGGGHTTLAYYPPIYDKNGVNTNPDRNTTTSTLKCLTCGKMWNCISQFNLTTYEQVVNTQPTDKEIEKFAEKKKEVNDELIEKMLKWADKVLDGVDLNEELPDEETT